MDDVAAVLTGFFFFFACLKLHVLITSAMRTQRVFPITTVNMSVVALEISTEIFVLKVSTLILGGIISLKAVPSLRVWNAFIVTFVRKMNCCFCPSCCNFILYCCNFFLLLLCTWTHSVFPNLLHCVEFCVFIVGSFFFCC